MTDSDRTELTGTGTRSTVRELLLPIAPDSTDAAIFQAVADYYNSTLHNSVQAQEYLRKRGLSGELIDRFHLGFSDRSLGLKLPEKNRRLGKAVRERLIAVGILKDTGHEAMRGSLVVPIYGDSTDIVGLYGRKVTGNLRAGTDLHVWIPTADGVLWNRQALRQSRSLVLCWSILDGLSVWTAGIQSVVAVAGHDGFTAAHLAQLLESGVQNIYVAYPNSDAANAAADALAVKLLDAGISAFKVGFPAGQDANDVLTGDGGRERLAAIIQAAGWAGKPKPRPASPVIAAPAAPAPAAPLPAQLPMALQAPQEPVGAITSLPSARSTAEPCAERTQAPVAPEARVAAVEAPAPSVAAVGLHNPLDPPVPASPALPMDISDSELVLRLDDRRYRVRGLARNQTYDQLKINLLVTNGDADTDARSGAFHADVLDLYSARQRAAFIKQASIELGLPEDVIRHDLGRLLFKLEELQEQAIRKSLEPVSTVPTMTPAESAAAMELLTAPDLTDRILADFDRCGVVGETTNKLLGYVAAVSRKLDDPLAVIVQSTSAAGKTSLMDSILAFVPPEDRSSFSAMTGQALFYMGESTLAHKVLAVAEEAGAHRASYALKLLQSEGELTIASTGKDSATGRLIAQEYRVQGPVALFFTTTAVELDEELANRCIVLTVNEDRDQTRAIHKRQRERQTLQGLLEVRERDAVLKLHHNAQRILQPVLVANPFAPSLTFLDNRTRTRRDHGKYLSLIRAVALLHQFQRPVQTVQRDGQELSYIEATAADIAIANRLAHELFGHSLDELPPHSRKLLQMINAMVSAECERRTIDRTDFRFGRREIRDFTGWTDFQVRDHLRKLIELEHVLVHRGGRGRLFEYELIYDGNGQDGGPFLPGLIDATHLRRGYDANSEPLNAGFEPPLSFHRAINESGSSAPDLAPIPTEDSASGATGPSDAETSHHRDINSAASYSQTPDRSR